LRKDAEPAERILALERARRNRGPADAVEAVSTRDQIELLVADEAALRVDALDRRVEVQRKTGREPRGDQVLHDLRLALDHDPASDELLEIEMVALAVELEIDAAVRDPLAVHPLPD